ncbi:MULTISPECIES: prepilin peptidase [unclassified Butyrivibrio]|uniref:prepilin peptidase n=1 Tax=unclassified Butyrivibrio TaxID=2639466 RepID=UPI000406E5EF|nr:MULTISPECIES: A24 family peptidase [unclassified Butyrivibrio]SEK92578.1 leader peptidase (prepilin peptidase) / N-methyltransferase [Butyrivibrio sp. ob235]
MELYYTICVALFGLLFGSFLNCMAMRIVRNEDFVTGRSHCMSCYHQLEAIDLIPVFSYVISGGKCRYCKQKISIRYPLTEMAFMVLSVVLYIFMKRDPVLFAESWILVGLLFAMAITDIESLEIPNLLILSAAVSWVIFSVIKIITGRIDLYTLGIRILTGLIFGALMLIMSILVDKLIGRESLGGGDIKLFALLGLYMGPVRSYELLILSCVLGIVFALIRKKLMPGSSKEFPLGPAIAVAAYIVLLFGDLVAAWYFKLI